MPVWTRRHDNGWLAEIRRLEDGRFRAQARPPVNTAGRSVRHYVVDDEQRAKELADNVAHPDCGEQVVCDGPWVESD